MSRAALFVLDVGHGNSAVLVDAKGVVVIDAGPGSSLLEFLRKENIDKIDALLISHADEDHIRGIIALLGSQKVRIGVIRLNTDSAKESQLWDDLTWELNKANDRGELKFDVGLTTNDTNKFNLGNMQIQVLAPSPYLAAKGPGSIDHNERRLTTNSLSAVIRLVAGTMPLALFTGDIDSAGLENLVESGADAKASLLTFPHHGGRSGQDDVSVFADRLCDITQPDAIVFSIGRGRFKNPQPEIVAAIRRKLPSARILCTQLSEHCSANLPKAKPTHLAEVYAVGQEGKKCCAGTIVVNFDGATPQVLPEADGHKEFIKNHVTAALCMK